MAKLVVEFDRINEIERNEIEQFLREQMFNEKVPNAFRVHLTFRYER